MGLDAGERHHRPDLGHYHFRRPAWHRSLGDRAAGRHQYGVRRLGADRDGAACPRDRSAFGCPRALSEAALIGKNLNQQYQRRRTSRYKDFWLIVAFQGAKMSIRFGQGLSSDHVRPSRSRAFAITTSFLMIAVRATFPDFPARMS